MKTMAKVLTACGMLFLLAGCPLSKTKEEATKEAYQRWYATRAGILLGVGEEQFNVGDLDNARSSATEALSLQPDLLPAQILLARVEIEKGNYVKAAAQLDMAIQHSPANGQLHYLLGVTCEKRGQYEQALEAHQKARALGPGNPAYIMAAAEVLVQLGRPQEGLETLESKLSSIDPSAGVYKAAGELALLAGQPRKAVDHFSQARLLSPEDPSLLEGLAKANYFASRPREAIATLQELQAVDDYDQRSWLHTMLGNSYLAAEKPRDAKASFERAVDLDRTSPENWVNLAKASLACNDLHRTVLAANQALTLRDNLLDAHMLLGCGLLAQGRAEQAREALAKSVQRYPEQAVLQCLLGRSYSALGDAAQARQCFESALAIEPGNVVARQLLADAQP